MTIVQKIEKFVCFNDHFLQRPGGVGWGVSIAEPQSKENQHIRRRRPDDSL